MQPTIGVVFLLGATALWLWLIRRAHTKTPPGEKPKLGPDFYLGFVPAIMAGVAGGMWVAEAIGIDQPWQYMLSVALTLATVVPAQIWALRYKQTGASR